MDLFDTLSPVRYSREEIDKQADSVFDSYFDHLFRENGSLDMQRLKHELRYLYILEERYSRLIGKLTHDKFTKPGTYPEWIISEVEDSAQEHLKDCFDEMTQNINDDELSFEDVKHYFGIK